MKSFWILSLVALFFIIESVSAASVQVDLNGQFYYGGAVTVSGTILPVAAHDVNILIIDANTGAQIDRNIATSDVNGIFRITYNNFVASTNGMKRDFNGFATDLNANVLSKFFFTIGNQASLDINFVGSKPPLTIGSDLVANFSPKNASGVGVDFNYISLKLLNSSGIVIKDVNNFVPNFGDLNRTPDYNFGTLTTPGIYTIIVDNGVASFNVPVIAFNLFVNSYNATSGEVQKDFSSGSDVNVRVLLSTTASTALAGAVSGTIEGPTGTSTTLNFVQVGGYYEDNIPGSVFSSEGTYVVRVNANALNYNQKTEYRINVSSYSMNLKPQKNVNAGKKERMKGVYSASSPVIFEIGITKLSDKSELNGLDLNNACDENKLSLEVFKTGSSIGVQVNFDLNNVADTTCDINFSTPSTSGEYYYKITGNDLNVSNSAKDLIASTGLKVQNQVVFFDPVDPSAYLQDPANSWQFKFYTDQNIGFKLVTIDLNLGIDSNVSAVNYAIIRQGSSQIKIASTYFDYNVAAQMLIVKGNALTDNNVSAGYVPIEFYVNVDANVNSSDANNILGFGGFKYKKMNLKVEPSDVNSSAKNTSFGPPSFKASDENVYLKVTANTAGDTAVKYANVTLYSLKNENTWQDINVDTINDYSDNNGLITNTSGIARLYLGQLASGNYFGQVKVQNGNDVDYADLFFMVKNYFVFAQPMTLDNGQCVFLDTIGSNNDFNIVIVAMLPNGGAGNPGDPVDDYLPIQSDTKIFLMSKGEEFKEPTQYSPRDMNIVDINCMGFMGPPDMLSTFKALALSPPASGWTSGNYRVLVQGTSATYGTESGDGFFRVQPFKFKLIPVTFGGERGGDKMLQASPGGTFDINAFSDTNVTLRAIMVDEKTMQDVNSNLNFIGSADVNEGQTRAISIKIPPISSSVQLGEYPIIIIAQDRANPENVAEQEIKLGLSLFILSTLMVAFMNRESLLMTQAAECYKAGGKIRIIAMDT
ncbi:MAG: hypothetical protein NTY48_05930 [Candidatus Diapherotrites archaeon]|nr:hypothetical protein [Candidatus Diapherotrites archaeon]